MISAPTIGESDHNGTWPQSPNAPDGQLKIALLGPLEIRSHDGAIDAVGKFGGIIGLLACSPSFQRSRESIAALFWGEKNDELSKHNLRQIIMRIRRLSVANAFLITDLAIGLVPERVECDLWSFNALLRDGSDQALANAVQLYRGPLLANVSIREAAWEEWLQDERSRWDQAVADTCVRLGKADLEAGNTSRAIVIARKAVQIDGFREDAHRILMRGLVMQDRRSEALRHYDALAAFLERELDTEPDELTQALAVSLKQETSVSVRTAPAVRLGAGAGADLERIAKQVIGVSGLGVLVAEPSSGHALQDGQAFLDACLGVAETHGGRLSGQDKHSPCLIFENVRNAAAAGFAILGAMSHQAGRGSEGRAQVRLGLHVATQLANEDAEIAASSAAVARQLSRLAETGQMLLSAEAREYVVASVDVELRDLGEQPDETGLDTVRSFVITEPARPLKEPDIPAMPRALLPVVAVIPFVTHASDPDYAFLGDILADEMIVSLSQSIEVNVISRLSTAALRSRSLNPQQIHAFVDATYIASGSCYVSGKRFQLTVEFTDARSGSVVWIESLTGNITDALVQGGAVEALVLKVKATIMLSELSRSRQSPLAELSDCTLLLGAIAMMHQLSPSRFEISRDMLDLLIQRAPRHAAPHAWLGMFLLLRASQGWSVDLEADAAAASDCTQRALDLEPDNSLALAVDAHVHTQFKKDFEGAAQRLKRALESNPNNSLAWLFKCTMHAFQGEGTEAVVAADSAMRLSPLDPRRWFYDSLAATAALGATDYDRAIALAQRSIQANATHASSFRALAIAQSLSGRMEEAKLTVSALMKVQPGLTAAAYRMRHPSGASTLGSLWADALRRAGVPE